MSKLIKWISLVFLLIVGVAIILGVKVMSTKKEYFLDQNEIGKLAYSVIANNDSRAAERIGLYFQFCSFDRELYKQWFKISDELEKSRGDRVRDNEK